VDWRERFVRAYDIELQEWVASVAAGERPSGPSSWDGYAAQAVATAGLRALHEGVRTSVRLRTKPDIYQ
jgi:myo-inositol 2-dehydrogenase/D-chiro-inositol 1-dehydrogenase